MLDAKNALKLLNLQTRFAHAALGKSVAYWKSADNVSTGANAALSQLFEQRTAEWRGAFASLLDKMCLDRPADGKSAAAGAKQEKAADRRRNG